VSSWYQTSDGRDKRFGAGQINIYNSYHVLNTGERNSAEDGGTTIPNTGNIWVDLLSNREYQLKVIAGAGQTNFE